MLGDGGQIGAQDLEQNRPGGMMRACARTLFGNNVSAQRCKNPGDEGWKVLDTDGAYVPPSRKEEAKVLRGVLRGPWSWCVVDIHQRATVGEGTFWGKLGSCDTMAGNQARRK